MQEAPSASDRRPGMDCPTCGAPAERGQLVCLECGSRIALSYRRPPSWKLPVAIVAAVSVLALAGAIAAYDAIDDDAKSEVAATPLDPKEAPATAEEKTTGERTSTEKTTATEEKTSTTREKAQREKEETAPAPSPVTGGLVRDGALFTWPRSLKAFTVVVLSNEDRASATKFANGVAQAGAAKAGVIRSDDFKTLPKGFFVVFAGSYPNQARADRAAARLGRRYPGAFPQRVSR